MSSKIAKKAEKDRKKNNQPQDGFLDNQPVIILIGILLFTAGIGVNIARTAWGVTTWKSLIWNVVFLVMYMIVFECIKIYRLYHIKQEEYEAEKRKARKAGRMLPQKSKIDFLFEAANHRKR